MADIPVTSPLQQLILERRYLTAGWRLVSSRADGDGLWRGVLSDADGARWAITMDRFGQVITSIRLSHGDFIDLDAPDASP